MQFQASPNSPRAARQESPPHSQPSQLPLRRIPTVLAAMACCLLLTAAAPPSTDTKLRSIIQPVSGAQMKKTVEKLVSFGTRHTLSSQTDPKRGIGAALEWTRSEFQRYSAACGNCLTIVDPSEEFTGKRIPTPTRVRDMVAIQRGTERP